MSAEDNLYRRKAGGIWYGRVEVAGREYRRSLRTRSRAEAKRERDAWIKKLQGQAFSAQSDHTWAEAGYKYLTEILENSVKPGTAKRYRVSLRQLDPYMLPKTINGITRKTIADFIATRSAAGATNATIRRDLTAMSRVLAACVLWEWRDDNPARDFDRSLFPEKRDPIHEPADEEIDRMIALCPPGFGNIVRFLRGTGARANEGVTLDWSEVSVERGEITFLRTKTNAPRVIRIADCSPWVSAHLAGTPKKARTGYVFTHGEGLPYRNFASRFVQIRDRAKAQFRCHDLRHKFAIEWVRKDPRRIYELQRHMGHATIKTTEIYLAYVPGTKAGT